MEEIICEAIRSGTSLQFTYRGGGCTVDPYCLGISAQGEMILLAYHRSGSGLPGTTGQGTGWMSFPINKLSDLKSTGIHVNERPAPNVKEKIVEVICCADES